MGRSRWFGKCCRKFKQQYATKQKSLVQKFISNVCRASPKLWGFRNICGYIKNVSTIFDDPLKRLLTGVGGGIIDEKQNQVYQIFMQHPALHQPCPQVDMKELIENAHPKDSAKHHASFLWHWRYDKARKKTRNLEYLAKYLNATVQRMLPIDLQILRTIILHNCADFFPTIKTTFGIGKLQALVQAEIHRNPQVTSVLMEAIHKWFTVMPILEQLAKCTSWSYICDTKACLLGTDVLYSILVNVVYHDPQQKCLMN